MALRYSFDLGDAADLIDRAVAQVLEDGLRTPDLGTANTDTAGMGDAVLAAVERLS
jgi:3-isopropylmalate dehydrogenase